MGGREAATCVVVFCIFPTIPVESTLLASVLLSQLDDQRKLVMREHTSLIMKVILHMQTPQRMQTQVLLWAFNTT